MLVPHGTKDLANVFAEPNVKHSIDFVKHRNADAVVGQHAPAVHVHDPAGCPNDDFGSTLQALGLNVDSLPTVDGQFMQACVLSQHVELSGDLNGQLPSGHEAQGAKGVALFKQVQDGQTEGSCLPCACLGLAHDVTAGDGLGDELRLHLGGVLESGIGDAGDDLGPKAQVSEGLLGIENVAHMGSTRLV